MWQRRRSIAVVVPVAVAVGLERRDSHSFGCGLRIQHTSLGRVRKLGQPQQARGQQGEAEEVARRLLVASGHSAKLLESVEEEFDQVALAVEVRVEMALHLPGSVRRDDDLHSLGADGGDHRVGVVSLVGDEVAALRSRDQCGRLDDVVDVAGREVEVCWITETIHESVDLGGKASARASNTLLLGPPFPPAPCW